MSDTSYSAHELEDLLDDPLDPALSSRRTASSIAQALTNYDRTKQDFVLRWVNIISKTNAELAYQFAQFAPQALDLMNLPDVEGWVIHAMDMYDKKGLYPACGIFSNVDAYAVETSDSVRGIAFDEVAGILTLFVRGLSGRELKLEPGEDSYTDTNTLFLPHRMSLFGVREDNFHLYKAIATHLWAQTWYGSFRADLAAVSRSYEDPDKALLLLHALETIRLNAHIAADLPGLHREMQGLQQKHQTIDYPPSWEIHIKRLQQSGATVQDSCDSAQTLYGGELPQTLCYQGRLLPELAQQALQQRVNNEKLELQRLLSQLAQDLDNKKASGETMDQDDATEAPQFKLEQIPDPNRPDDFLFELSLDDQPLSPPENLQGLLSSIMQDLGEIPPEYLVAAGDGGYRKSGVPEKDLEDEEAINSEEGVLFYNEWDFRRQHYRKNWCTLREIDVHPNHEPFVQHTLHKYAGLLKNLRKTFEALRGEDKLLKRQTDGDDIDFDAVIEAQADVQHGMEMPQQLFTKLRKVERNIAVMFMVDMSGSTKGWINDAEREALVLLCETLEILGDRYAIYGFSGLSRKRCELFRVKRFDENYDDLVKARITGIKPQDYTRMGVTIRHLSQLLEQIEARTKLLITLSDGKPDDFDGYRGDYGIEDTRQALIEAKRMGIHPFCITIDEEARDYLPHMYGAVNYTVIDDVRKMPLKVADIYRRLTV